MRSGSCDNRLVALLLDALGHEVTVETRDGTKFEGILAATHPKLDIGLSQVHKVEHNKLLPYKDDVCEKMIIGCDDYVCISAVLQDEKPKIKGFATDREYHSNTTNGYEESTFVPWNADESVEIDESKTDDLANGGWSADDMFDANKALGVESTYVENMSQYTNTPVVEKDSEDRIRAEKIAHEIEQDRTSRTHAMLENDDEERDLDKSVSGYQVQNHRRNLPANRSSYGSNSRGSLPGNSGSGRNGVQSGRRGDVPLNLGRTGKRERFPNTEGNSKRERFPDSKARGRGNSYNSGLSRSFTNSALTHSSKGSGSSLSGNNYVRYQGTTERPSAQMVHNEFSQFEMQQAGGDGIASSNSAAKFGERRSNQSESVTTNTKVVHEPSHRTARHSTNSPHNRSGGEDGRSSTRGGSPHTGSRPQSNTLIRPSSSASTAAPSIQKPKHPSGITTLRAFKSNFDSAFQPSQSLQTHSFHEDGQNNSTNSSSSTATSSAVQQPNAWNKGPPLSIRSPPSQSSQQNTMPKEPTPAESVQTSVGETVHSSKKSREGNLCIQNATLSKTAVVLSSATPPSVVQATTLAESPHRLSGSGSSSPPSTQASIVALSSSVQQMTVTNSASGTPVLSANGSSSSIAPVDPQPSINTSISSAGGNASTPQISNKKFAFNPDATPFTPRYATAHTPTPRSTPAPTGTAALHVTHSVHPLSLNSAQTISVAQGLSSGVIAQPANPFSFNPSAGVYSPVPVYYGTQPVLPMSTQIAQVSASPAAAGVTGGPIVAGSATVAAGRTGQVTAGTASSRRAPLIGSSVYIPNTVHYGPQVIPQYPLSVFASPFQQLSMGSASVPPPTVPPPASSGVAVGATPQPLQILQAQHQHSQTAYTPRQYYQPGQGYLLATAASAPRAYAPQHQGIDYNGSGQQPSSTASSNGNGSNGHNSQPATPGPQPIASPAQQFPFMPNAGYMVYNPQQMMPLSAIPSATTMGLNQASQSIAMDQYQSISETQGTSQHNANNQTHGSMPSQQYMTTDQSYGPYLHGGN